MIPLPVLCQVVWPMTDELLAAVIEWRDARAAFLDASAHVAHTDDDYIPQDVSRRYNDADAKLFEVAKRILSDDRCS
jgi:hypothetical protein